MKNHLIVLCGALCLGMVGQVSATTTWTIKGAAPTVSGSYTATGVAVAAFANTGGNNTSAELSNNGQNQTIQSATWVGSYGGITNADSCAVVGGYCDANEGIEPEHAIDNQQRYDMALLSFGSDVKLTSLYLSYISGDADVTVLRYSGSANPLASTNGPLIGKTYSELAVSGWLLVGNYGSTKTTGTDTRDISVANSGGSTGYSSFWLIGAYNPLAGGSTSGLNAGDDHIKLASVFGCSKTDTACNPSTNSSVPEPGSLALLGIGLFGLIRLRKSQKD